MKFFIKSMFSTIKSNYCFIVLFLFSAIATIFSLVTFALPILYVSCFFLFYFLYNFIFLILKTIKYLLVKLSISNYINNIKIDIDSTTNTDGEDLLSYINDFTEISLQDRAYFFDWIFTNPFEFILYSSVSYIFLNLILKGYQRVTISVFKFIKR